MTYMQGSDLSSVLVREGNLPVPRASARQVASDPVTPVAASVAARKNGISSFDIAISD